MSLIADALKKAQGAKFGRRYLSSEPSGTLPVARQAGRAAGESSLFARFQLSPTLLVGLGSGLLFFVLLFAYFFYGKPNRVKSPSSVAAVTASKDLMLSPPPATAVIEPPPLQKLEAEKTPEPVSPKPQDHVRPAERLLPEQRGSARVTADEEPTPRPAAKTQARKALTKEEKSGLSVVSDISQEVRYHFNLAVSYQEEKNFYQAKREYERVLQMWPLFGEAHNNLGLVYKELGNYDEAVAEFKKALVLDPNYAKAHHNLGVIYQIKGDWKQAIKNYENALSLDRNHLGAYNNLGLVYRSQSRPDEARKILEKAVAVNPSFPQTHYNLAVVLDETGEPDAARLHYQKFVDLSGEGNRQLVDGVRLRLRALAEKK